MSKNIVVCCDGTSNDVTGDSTNVLKLFRCLERSGSQVTYYSPGVGTVSDPTMKTVWGRRWSKKLDIGLGHGVRSLACDIYRFLSKNFVPGDRIFLFGFSRGAYAIRSVAGMIRFLGLLRAEQAGLEKHAWSVYADDDQQLDDSSRFSAGNRFASSFCTLEKPQIYFVGAWDTVSSFGWLWNLRTLPYTRENGAIRHIRHAVSIDERRAMFRENLFVRHKENESFEQVWFPGGHGDIGGGWPDEINGISRFTLAWMATQAQELGLLLDPDRLNRFTARNESEKVALQVNDALRGWWWLIEMLPRRKWNGRKERMTWSIPHMGRRRRIPPSASQLALPSNLPAIHDKP